MWCENKTAILKWFSLKIFHSRFSEKLELVCACYYEFRCICVSRYLNTTDIPFSIFPQPISCTTGHPDDKPDALGFSWHANRCVQKYVWANRQASYTLLYSNTSAALRLLHLSRISALLSFHCVIVLWRSLCWYRWSEDICFSSSSIRCSVRCLQRVQALCKWQRSSCRIAW